MAKRLCLQNSQNLTLWFILTLVSASLTAGFVVPNQHVLSSQTEGHLDLFPTGVKACASSFNALINGMNHSFRNLKQSGMNDQFYSAMNDVNNRGFGPDESLGDGRNISPYPSWNPFHPVKPNQTIYQMITTSPHTKTFAKMVSEFDDIVHTLNSTSANSTVYIPPNKALEKFKDCPYLSRSYLKKLIQYHISPKPYTRRDLFSSLTVPSLLEQDELGHYPQRISIKLGLFGLSLNSMAWIKKSNLVGLYSPPPFSLILY